MSELPISAEDQEKILNLQQSILESVAHGGDSFAIINQLCDLAERLLPNSVASVMLLDKAREFLNVYAAPSVPPEGQKSLSCLRPGPGGGSCGNAVFRSEPQFVQNTFTDPRWLDLRQLAYDFNLCACWSMPIFSSSGEVIGSFALSSFEHRMPSSFHRKLLEIGASIAGIVIERSKAQESIRLFEQVFDGSEEGILITDVEERILSVNRSLCQAFGYEESEIIGQSPRMFSSGYHDQDFYREMWKQLSEFGLWQGEVWNRRQNGEAFPEWLSISAVRDPAGILTHYVGIFSDISERKNSELQIQHLATHDPLTDLPNRMLFEDRMENAIANAAVNGNRVALLALDIDNFKMLNESYGHSAGDLLLRAAAERIKNCLKTTDTVSRQGGDEFHVLLSGQIDSEVIGSTAQGVLAEMAKPFEIEGSNLTLSCSIGIAVYPEDGKNYDALQSRAETAMRAAKDAGRNACRFFTERMNSDSAVHLRLAHNLRQALEKDEFTLHYQPQIELKSGKITGVEALIRWNHPGEGLIAPDRFIAAAEQTGLIVPIGEWVLKRACSEFMQWRGLGFSLPAIAVNVSALQFRRGNFEGTVKKALEVCEIDPGLLEIEITESILLQDEVFEQIDRLKAMGVKLAIDDFGTGYSSLAYLKKFKADKLKIDKSFVHDLLVDPDAAAIVKAMIQMGHALNLATIAEGVESGKAVDLLTVLGCDEIQGYLVARPMPAEKFIEFLAARA